MSRNKQIEEIVQDVDKAIRANFAWDVLAGGYIVSSADNIAQELYYKGYCKSTDVAEEIFAEIENTARAAIILLKFEKDEKLRNTKTECYEDLLGYIADLKKKYTEEGK